MIGEKAIYFIGSDSLVATETLEKVRKVKGFEDVSIAPPSIIQPIEGYIAKFNASSTKEVSRIKKELSRIGSVEDPTLLFVGYEAIFKEYFNQ